MTAVAEAPVRESVLSLTGVSKRFGAVQALSDVGLQVGAGMMGSGGMGPGMMGSGWQAANGTYGMIFTFTTS